MAAPLVTVVIPCYNYAEYLAECIDSVLAQTYPHWELFVVDDASTRGDVTAEVARFPDPRIHLIRHEQNRGLSASRNTGIRAGSGELALPLDADDKLAPAYLEKLVPLLVAHPGYDAVFPDFQEFGAQHDRRSYQVSDIPTLLVSQWIPGPGSLLRRSLFDAVGGYFEGIRAGNEDWDFWLGVAERGIRVGHLAEPLYYYRLHGESMVTRLRVTEYEVRDLIYSRHRALFDKYGRGRLFRAEGYRQSAIAAWTARRRADAIRLTLRGALLSPAPFTRAMLRGIRRRLR